jgi:hypothetical protein
VQGIQNIVRRDITATAVVVTAVLFFLLNLLCTPLLNSGDDSFLMYNLGGGFTGSPTDLLHYRHVWHHWIAAPVKYLFGQFPGLNWYSLVLVLLHFLGMIGIAKVFFKRLGWLQALIIFLLLFISIESKFLLSLNLTSTAFIASVGALFYMLDQMRGPRIKWLKFVPSILLLFVAGLLRFHVCALTIVLFCGIAACLKLTRRRFGIFAGAGIGMVLLLMLAFNFHDNYYRRMIPGWEKQEAFRAAYFNLSNHPLRTDRSIFSDPEQQQRFNAGLFLDSTEFNVASLRKAGNEMVRQRWMNQRDDWQSLYWIAIESRLYIAILLLVLLVLFAGGKKNLIRRWGMTLIPIVLVFAGLFVFMKVTWIICIALALVAACVPVLLVDESGLKINNRAAKTAVGVLAGCLFVWSIYSVAKVEKQNRHRREIFICAFEKLKASPDTLFVSTSDRFPIHLFYVWDVPKNYPAFNLLYRDRLLNPVPIVWPSIPVNEIFTNRTDVIMVRGNGCDQ